MAISCSYSFITFWNLINQIIWSFFLHYFKHTTILLREVPFVAPVIANAALS